MVAILAANAEVSGPLGVNEALWERALAKAQDALTAATRASGEPAAQVFAVVAAAARLREPRAPALVGLLRRILVRSAIDGETSLRCLRTLARAGSPIDVARLVQGLAMTGRVPRLALAALAELAARDDGVATGHLAGALETNLRADAAMLLSHVATEAAVDALAPWLRAPGATGLYAATALVAAEDDPFAFEQLCERLCEPSDSVLAAGLLWGAAAEGARLREAEAVLARWARRGVARAESGRLVAACVLTAGGIAQDLPATLRALSSEEDELVLLGTQAAYALGDAERAHGAALRLLRRGALIAAQSFALLARWADLGDGRAMQLVKTTLERRPVDLARSAVYEALAGCVRPGLYGVVVSALSSNEPGGAALEAARALARLREPPSVVPPLWL